MVKPINFGCILDIRMFFFLSKKAHINYMILYFLNAKVQLFSLIGVDISKEIHFDATIAILWLTKISKLV